MSDVLSLLINELHDGRVRIVDLTQPLGPETPVIGLPPQFASSPGVTMRVISEFDGGGPSWYWNELRFGEHTGTHFDAPGHWITGRDLPDNTTDTIGPDRFIGPACVIDVTARVAANDDYLSVTRGARRVGIRARRDRGGLLGAAAHRLEHARRRRGLSERPRRRPAQPRIPSRYGEDIGTRA